MAKLFKKEIIIAFFISFAFYNCSDVVEQDYLLNNNLSIVVISLGMPDENNTAPASFSSVVVIVTGIDMETTEETFPAPFSSISLNVPAGSSRQIEVTAYVSDSDPSAAISFRGMAVANLVAGETVTVPVIIRTHETKIVIPDYLNNRIVQIDDINGTNWTAKTNSDIGFGSTLYPYDTDYDSRGRIYIANYSSSSGEDIVIRIDNIQSASCVTIQSNSNSAIGSVSVDRINNLLYFSNGSDLFRSNLDGSNRTTLTKSGISNIMGLTFNDSNSMLYISCTYTSALRVVQYNPAVQGIENFSTTTNISDPASIPWDTLIRGSYVYVTNPGGSNDYLVLQLDSNLQYVNGYGTQTTSLNTNQGMFYNPRMFLAIRDDGIIMIDDLQGGPTALNKIISMQDITGAGWETFGSNGTGTNQFRFYYD